MVQVHIKKVVKEILREALSDSKDSDSNDSKSEENPKLSVELLTYHNVHCNLCKEKYIYTSG